MKRLACVIAGAFMLAGCGSVRYPASYLLHLPAPAPVPHTGPVQTVLGPLAVREFRCPDYVCEGRIVYRPSAEEVAFYEFHRWAISPGHTITESIVEALRARSLFRSVALHEQGTRPAYVLTGSLERLEEVDHGRDVRAVCTISAQLIDVQTGYVVWTGTASEAVPVEKRNVAGVVGSLSAAAKTAVDRLVASITDELAPAQNAARR